MAPRMRYMMSKIEMPDGMSEHAVIEHGRPGIVQRFRDATDAQMMVDMMNSGMTYEDAMAACQRVDPALQGTENEDDLENYNWDVKSFDLNFAKEVNQYLACLKMGYEPFAVVEAGIWLKKKIGKYKQSVGGISDGSGTGEAGD